MIISAQHDGSGGFLVTLSNGTIAHVPDDPNNSQRQTLADWVAAGNTIDAADPAPAPPTPGEIFDQLQLDTNRNSRVLKALILGLNDGSFVVGANLSNAALKAWFVARL